MRRSKSMHVTHAGCEKWPTVISYFPSTNTMPSVCKLSRYFHQVMGDFGPYQTNQKKEAEQASNKDTIPVAPYGLLYIARAYNRREISFEGWLRLTKEWAEQLIRQFGKAE